MKTSPSRALALVGMPGAGKTVCAKHVETRGFYQFRFGQIVVDEVLRRGQSITPENERVVREEFRTQDGMAAIAKRALPHLQKALSTRPAIIIDGLYSFSEYKLLRQELDEQLQRQLQAIGDDFHPGLHYVQAWGYELAPHGSVSYAPGAKVQSPRRAGDLTRP